MMSSKLVRGHRGARHLVYLIFCFLLLPLKTIAVALDPELTVLEPVQTATSYYQDHSGEHAWSTALQIFRHQKDPTTYRGVLSLGIGASPTWVYLPLDNHSGATLVRHVIVDTSWLDSVNTYLIKDGALQTLHKAGDRFTYGERSQSITGHQTTLTIPPGTSELLLRLETPDPLVAPIYVLDEDQLESFALVRSYCYGAGYGFLLALIAFNAFLYLGLKDNRYLFYALYLSAFTAANIAYTGHGFAWFWPNSVEWQRWSQPLLMTVFGTTGLLFTQVFLSLKNDFPRAYLLVNATIASALLVQLVCYGIDSQSMADYGAFSFMVVFAMMMPTLGALAWFHKSNSAKYFLIAVLAGAGGIFITTAAVWGLLPYHFLTFNAAEFGLLLEATLLALALANRFRVVETDKLKVLHLANTDSLTELHNRRFFDLQASALWSNSQRYQRTLSIIVLDLDGFKDLNDQHGHHAGDQVLQAVGGILQRHARAGDLVARWGGEEFVVLLPETQIVEASQLAERLRDKIASITLAHGDTPLTISASFGVAEQKAGDQAIEDVFARADQALYQSKLAGKNCVRLWAGA